MTIAVRRTASLAASFAAALALGLAVAPHDARAGQGTAPAPASPAQRPPAPSVRFDLRLTRTDEPVPADATAPAATTVTPPVPAVLGAPTLTTFAGQTASMNVTGADPSFSVSLSPTLESVDNGRQAVQVAWNLRLNGKSLPGGVTTVTLTGATRVPADAADATLAEVTLADPATGRVSRFRLGGRVAVGPPPAATDNPATPAGAAGTNGGATTSN